MIAYLGNPLLFCHTDSFPQFAKLTKPVEIQTAPLPGELKT
jgi:hypothetical protein